MVAFSQMKPEELLRESERAMGDSHLHSLHQELVEDGKNLKVAERVSSAAALVCSCEVFLYACTLVPIGAVSLVVLYPI